MDRQHQVGSDLTSDDGDDEEETDLPPAPTRAAISKDPFYEMLASRKKKVSTLKGL